MGCPLHLFCLGSGNKDILVSVSISIFSRCVNILLHMCMCMDEPMGSPSFIRAQEMSAACVFWGLKLSVSEEGVYLLQRHRGVAGTPSPMATAPCWGGAGHTGDGKNGMVFPSGK